MKMCSIKFVKSICWTVQELPASKSTQSRDMKNQPFASCIVHCFHIVDFIYRNCRPPAHRVHPGQSSHATVYIVNLEPFACVCVSTYIYTYARFYKFMYIYNKIICIYKFVCVYICIWYGWLRQYCPFRRNKKWPVWYINVY